MTETSPSGHKRRYFSLKCDNCQVIFTRKYCKTWIQNLYHFHSKECVNQANRVGNILYEVSKKTCQEKYGADHPSQSEQIHYKKIKTCRERYGSDYVFTSHEFSQKSIDTLFKKYGVSSFFKTVECRKALEISSLSRWGVKNPAQAKEIKDKAKLTTLERYGVNNVSQSEEIKLKKIETCQANFGVDNPFQSDEIMSKVNKPELYHKRIETMRRKGSILNSKPEDKIYIFLCEKYGIEFVERQVIVNKKWPIDLYVKSIDVYVQVDGIYWHGLDRNIETIAEHKTTQDVVIHKKWLTDRVQDDWFKLQNLNLLRILDIEALSQEGINQFDARLNDFISTKQEKNL